MADPKVPLNDRWDATFIKNPDGTYSLRVEGDLTVEEGTPTSGNNPSAVFSYVGNELTTITKTIDGTDYERTLYWTSGVLTGYSAWVEI